MAEIVKYRHCVSMLMTGTHLIRSISHQPAHDLCFCKLRVLWLHLSDSLCPCSKQCNQGGLACTSLWDKLRGDWKWKHFRRRKAILILWSIEYWSILNLWSSLTENEDEKVCNLMFFKNMSDSKGAISLWSWSSLSWCLCLFS